MKSIDFSHAGGFPLTQDELNYLQTAYTECVNTLTEIGVNDSAPVIITGMNKYLSGTSTISVSDGWFFYNGEMIRFTGSTVTPGAGTVALVQINGSTTNLTYNDGSVYPAVSDKTAILTAAASVTDTHHFPYSSMKLFATGLGNNARENSWNSLTVSTDPTVGGVTGTIYYKKNFLTNTLQIRSALTANNAQNFAASPSAEYYSTGNLPAAYIPANSTWFTAYFFLGSQIKDDLNVSWIKEIVININALGVIGINWIKPDVTVSGYGIVFNTVVSLD